MKRDMDLIREILLYIANSPGDYAELLRGSFPESLRHLEYEVVRDHVLLAKEDKLIEATHSSGGFISLRLRSGGYKFLEETSKKSRRRALLQWWCIAIAGFVGFVATLMTIILALRSLWT